MKNLRYRKDYLRKVIRRFERAVEEKAFEGTIPWDSEAAIIAHEEIEENYVKSRKTLINILNSLNGFSS